MDAEWIKSPTGRRIMAHWADPRPAWLWSHDGATLLWRNSAARLFRSKIKKHGLKLAPEAVPIRGQIARLVRLGSPERSSLSRLQFLAGDKPISETCACTPLRMPDGELALLIVAVDPIEEKLLQADGLDRVNEALFPAGSEYLLVDGAGNITGGSARASEHFGPGITDGSVRLPQAEESAEVEIAGEQLGLSRFDADAQGSSLLLFEPVLKHDAPGDNEPAPVQAHVENPNEPLLPLGLPPIEAGNAPESAATNDDWVEPFRPAEVGPGRALSSLFDRLAEDVELYKPITDKDDVLLQQDSEETVNRDLVEPEAGELAETVEGRPAAEDEAVLAAFFGDLERIAASEGGLNGSEPGAPPAAAEPEKSVLLKVVGRGFTPIAEPAQEPGETPPSEPDPDAESVERVSRYNFDELSRILTDRIGGDPATRVVPLGGKVLGEAPPATPAAPAESTLVNLTGETFVLNRLPLGILVFRDQQVLFANRALLDLVGYESVEALRTSGLASIFPAADASNVGPVTQIMRREGIQVPVNARLQSIAWQGRPALMLSASAAEMRIGHEAAVKAFAELTADARDEGFVTADRAGLITSVSGHGKIVLRRTDEELVGKPLSFILDAGEAKALKSFLERPARFAETSRPSLAAKGADADTDILLFAEGQAGVVTGYFGYARRKKISTLVEQPQDSADADPALLARVSRGVRRPLNTIIGFSDLIGSAAFGPIQNPRYLEYAGDIKSAGQEIAALVDELDDFTRLKDGRYAPRRTDVDLGSLLESCVVRVRGQASNGRVLVRSGISERLPRIMADRASLGQAVLNLMASAIDQTPSGSSVVLSAQMEDDGSIIVNIRDSAESGTDLGDRFVVFRDGVGVDGEALRPVRSSVGLALTRSLLAVNSCTLSVAPTGAIGTLFSMAIPAELIIKKLG